MEELSPIKRNAQLSRDRIKGVGALHSKSSVFFIKQMPALMLKAKMMTAWSGRKVMLMKMMFSVISV